MSETFNEGDRVYIYSSGYHALRKGEISRVTKTQAIVANERYEERFNRETGRLVGADAWNSPSISHPTERLDREWRRLVLNSARIALARAADKGDAAAIRSAYTKWNRLEREQS